VKLTTVTHVSVELFPDAGPDIALDLVDTRADEGWV
jgi:hypothetical protein